MKRAATPTLFPMFRFLLRNGVRVNCVRGSRSAGFSFRFARESPVLVTVGKRHKLFEALESLKIVLAFDSAFCPELAQERHPRPHGGPGQCPLRVNLSRICSALSDQPATIPDIAKRRRLFFSSPTMTMAGSSRLPSVAAGRSSPSSPTTRALLLGRLSEISAPDYRSLTLRNPNPSRWRSDSRRRPQRIY